MTQPYELDWVRLPLEGAHNVRELGGYPAAGGVQTRYHRFLRSDGLNALTNDDIAFLHAYGVRMVLDLRDASEAEHNPDRVLGEDVSYCNVPLLAFDMSQKAELERRFMEETPTYEFLYSWILGNKEGIRRCFEAIAALEEGCVLFHCAVGKDRTGVLALLLMALAGCDKWDCVTNYQQTRANLMRHDWYVEAWENPGPMILNDSPTHVAEYLWSEIESAGGVVAYLHECGIAYETIETVRARLLS